MKPTVIRLTDIDRARVEKLIEWGYGSKIADTVRWAIQEAYATAENAQHEKTRPRF